MKDEGTCFETSGIVVDTSSARDTLQHLLSDLDTVLPQGTIPAKPVWILASSSSLRRELIHQILAHRKTTLGIVVHTLHSASLTVLQRVHESLPEQNALTDIWIRRASKNNPVLYSLLNAFDDDFGVVTRSVMDLLDAGISPFQEEALLECVATAPPGPRRERAQALIKIAIEISHALSEQHITTSAGLVQHGARWIEDHPEQALDCQHVLVVGFSDTHAHGGDFLTALLRHANTRIYQETPDDPAVAGQREAGHVFAQRTRERLVGAAKHFQPRNNETAPPALEAFHAYGAEEEIREVGRRIQSLLYQGVLPESIGIVARRMDTYALPIRHHLHRLGIPFGMQQEPIGIHPLSRHLLAVNDVLHTMDSTLTDRWLDALCPYENTQFWWNNHREYTRADIREGLRLLGVRTLGALPSLLTRLTAEGSLPLRTRNGRLLEGASARSQRRKLSHKVLLDIAQCADDFLNAPWKKEAPLAEHLATIRQVFAEQLGWGKAPEGTSWIEALDRLQDLDEMGDKFSHSEALLLLSDATRDLASGPDPGNRSGVRVLDATTARGLTFDHLFLVGMNRGLFPRPIVEDSLLPDGVRSSLLPILPDLAIKQRGHDEERFLFAQLLAASKKATLSWQRCDHDGTEKARSVFVERLQIADTTFPITTIPRDRAASRSEPYAGGLEKPRDAFDLALLGALTQGRTSLAPLLHKGIASSPLPEDSSLHTADARMRILDEAEPSLATKEGRERASSSGPFLGFVGIAPTEPEAPLYVTALEDLARCPWQFFMHRVLRITPPVEGGLLPPILNNMMVGNVAHGTLQDIVGSTPHAPSNSVEEALSSPPTSVARPTTKQVDETIAKWARKICYEEGIFVDGLIDMLVVLSRPLVHRFLDWDWPEKDSVRDVYGAELEGHCTLTDHAGRPRRIAFKADRVENQDNKILFTDLKTGKPLSDKALEKTRLKALTKKASEGGALQVLAYAASQAGPTDARYLYGAENALEAARELRISNDDPLIQSTLKSITSATVEAYDRGLYFPRLVQHNINQQPKACEWCSLREACSQGDSTSRRRLQKIAEKTIETPDDRDAALFHELWFYRSLQAEEDAS